MCPLCRGPGPFGLRKHRAWKERRFFQCPDCDLFFVPSQDQITPENERARYETHHNDLGQRGFREFLMKTVDLLVQHAQPPLKILDYGSGPEPSMAQLLTEAGYEVSLFDPYFQPLRPTGDFDLILLHEVFEHLREPRTELEKIKQQLRAGGRLVIRTELRPADFENWWYARDNTHILFPSSQTMAWIAQDSGFTLELWSPVVTALRSSVRSSVAKP
ncbi:MAG: class I SAM-dependent methyltransferase [Bdellovibrio sp.]